MKYSSIDPLYKHRILHITKNLIKILKNMRIQIDTIHTIKFHNTFTNGKCK